MDTVCVEFVWTMMSSVVPYRGRCARRRKADTRRREHGVGWSFGSVPISPENRKYSTSTSLRTICSQQATMRWRWVTPTCQRKSHRQPKAVTSTVQELNMCASEDSSLRNINIHVFVHEKSIMYVGLDSRQCLLRLPCGQSYGRGVTFRA